MRYCVEQILDRVKNRFSAKLLPPDEAMLASEIEAYGCFKEIDECIRDLVCAETDRERLDAIRRAYQLQWKLSKAK